MKTRFVLSNFSGTDMKQLILSLICLAVMMGRAGYGQGVSARSTPAQTATVAPPRVVHHPVRRPSATPTPGPKLHGGNGTNMNTKPARQPVVISYSDALRRFRHERHDRVWWRSHFTTIVFVTGGYYYWDAGYWFPAWGYDPLYESYDYDGPIYTYGNLLPDQVIINVQRALQEQGYYSGGLTGSLGPGTRAALAAYQQDAGLVVTGVIDEPTVEALGLVGDGG